MSVERWETGDDEGETKYEKQKPLRNLYHITCNACREKLHYMGNNESYTYKNLKE